VVADRGVLAVSGVHGKGPVPAVQVR
jgi:hypothetical protein